jgi:fatty acid desaturase
MTNPQARTLTNADDSIGAQHPLESTASSTVDLATIGVAGAVYGAYLVLTWHFRHLGVWLAPIGAVLLTWHGSLQHETIHGHPTPSRRFNSWIAGPPLALWIPYRIYRVTHLKHHRHGGRFLSKVSHDPESFFLSPGTLAKSGWFRRTLYVTHCTLIGRLIFGPALSIGRLWAAEVQKILRGNRPCRIIWARHGFGVAIVLLWTVGVCHIPIWAYLAFMVYPSASLSHLRSFTEHRADSDPAFRTMAVEAHPMWALIFLNNNLHIAHHAHPKLPWHQLPRAWRQMRVSADEAGLVFSRGYSQVAGKYLFRPVISVEHPDQCIHEVADMSHRATPL